MSLEPASQFVNDLVVGGRAPQGAPDDHLALREAWGLLATAMPAPDFHCQHETVTIDDVPAILLTPPVPTDRLLVWFHGGGWVIGTAEQSLAVTDLLASLANTKVLTVDYRLAPEFAFPVAYDDALNAVTWALDHAQELDVDPSRISVGGDSAGGNLAAAVAQHFGTRLASQLLVYPAVDLARTSPAAVEHGDGYLLNTPTMSWFAEQYLQGHDPLDPRCSPLRAPDDVFANVAPAHIVVAEFDPLRDDGVDYAARLRDNGVSVSVDHHADQMHGFFTLPHVLPGGHEAVARAAQFLRRDQ